MANFVLTTFANRLTCSELDTREIDPSDIFYHKNGVRMTGIFSPSELFQFKLEYIESSYYFV